MAGPILIGVAVLAFFVCVSLLVRNRVRTHKTIEGPDDEIIQISETHYMFGQPDHYETERRAEHHMEFNKHHG